METVFIVAGIVVLAVVVSMLLRWTDKRRQMRREHQRTDAEAYIVAHAVTATTIRQAYACKDIDARLLKVRLSAIDPSTDRSEVHATQIAVTDFLDSCEEMATELGAIIAYDHGHFKRMPASYQHKIVATHEKWHETLDGLRTLATGLAELRKQYVYVV